MPIGSYAFEGLGWPYHLADNVAQMVTADAKALLWLYGLQAVPEEAGRPEEHSQPAPRLVANGETNIPPGTNTLEIGVWYGASLYPAAVRARHEGALAVGLDEFGRPEAKFPGEPTYALAIEHLKAEGLLPWCGFVPGTSKSRADFFASESFGCVFSGADHSGRWALSDMPFADRVTMPGGLIAVHAMHGTPEKQSARYDDPRLNAPDGRPYERVVRDCAAEFGWKMIRRFPGSSIEVYRKGGSS